jgi:hypothetical protein
MGNRRGLLLLLIITLSASMLTYAASASVESMGKTPTPELSVRYIDNSYDVPAYTAIDPFTGENQTIPTQHINNQTIVVTVKNHTVTYEDKQLIYLLQMKGHYTNEWTNISSIDANPHSEYTISVFAIDGNNASGEFTENIHEIISGDTADFRVQALIRSSFGSPYHMEMYAITSMSDWSPTQTVTIPASTSSPYPSQTSPVPTYITGLPPENPLLEIVAITVIVIAVLLAVAILFLNKRKSSKNC